MLEEAFSRLKKIYPEMVLLRRDFHRYPELGFKEVRTPAKIASFLKSLNIEVRERVGGNGVVARIPGGKPGKTIALRADFDALPLQEETDAEYMSCIPGIAHACGHDLHTAALLGVAKVLKELQQNLAGNVLLIFQHAEEVYPGGAKSMIDDGCLSEVDVIYGAHVTSLLPIGTVGIKEGYMSAISDSFDIEICGRGGHGAFPHLSSDPLVTASQLVVNLQQVVSRRIDPLKPAIVTVGSFHSGTTNNIIPDTAKLSGTVRAFDEDVRDLIEKSVGEMATATAAGAGATVRYSYHRGYPATLNDSGETKRVEKIAARLLGKEQVLTIPPIMSGEDFSYYVQKVPGAFFAIGGRNQEARTSYPAHHPKFDVDERCMLHIGNLFTALVVDYLSQQQ